MNEASEATELIIPGAPPPAPAPDSGALGLAVWAFAGVLLIAAVVTALRGRRRSIDPSERAFRRIASGLGLSRAQVRAIRRAAADDPSQTPVAIALSPELTNAAIRAHNQRLAAVAKLKPKTKLKSSLIHTPRQQKKAGAMPPQRRTIATA